MGSYLPRILVCSCSLVVLLCVSCNTLESPNCTPNFTEARVVETSDFRVTTLWAIDGINIENFPSSTLMVGTNGMIIAVDLSCERAIALDFPTGEVIWVTDNIPQSWNLTLDEGRGRIYISAVRQIQSLSILTGERIWVKGSEDFVRNSHVVELHDDGQLTVDANGERFIDPETGDLFDHPVGTNSSGFEQLSEDESNVELTHIDLNNFTIASNIVEFRGNLYVLDSDARLHLLSADGLEELGTIQFERPEPTDLLYEPGAIGGSWIAVDNDMVAIYFQDTDILAVYEVDLSSLN